MELRRRMKWIPAALLFFERWWPCGLCWRSRVPRRPRRRQRLDQHEYSRRRKTAMRMRMTPVHPPEQRRRRQEAMEQCRCCVGRSGPHDRAIGMIVLHHDCYHYHVMRMMWSRWRREAIALRLPPLAPGRLLPRREDHEEDHDQDFLFLLS